MNRSLSFNPLGRWMRSMRLPMMKIALHTIARVSAICRAISTTPALWRRNAASMGCRFMSESSLALQLPRRRDARGAERGIQRGQKTGEYRHGERGREQGNIQMRQIRDVSRQHQSYAGDADGGQAEAKHAAGQPDHPALGQELRVNRR